LCGEGCSGAAEGRSSAFVNLLALATIVSIGLTAKYPCAVSPPVNRSPMLCTMSSLRLPGMGASLTVSCWNLTDIFARWYESRRRAQVRSGRFNDIASFIQPPQRSAFDGIKKGREAYVYLPMPRLNWGSWRWVRRDRTRCYRQCKSATLATVLSTKKLSHTAWMTVMPRR